MMGVKNKETTKNRVRVEAKDDEVKILKNSHKNIADHENLSAL